MDVRVLSAVSFCLQQLRGRERAWLAVLWGSPICRCASFTAVCVTSHVSVWVFPWDACSASLLAEPANR